MSDKPLILFENHFKQKIISGICDTAVTSMREFKVYHWKWQIVCLKYMSLLPYPQRNEITSNNYHIKFVRC